MKTINLSEKNGVRASTFRCRCCVGQSHSFFRKKPRLSIGRSIVKVPIELTVAWQRQGVELRDPKVFRANIWALEVSNTRRPIISATATKCSATLHIRNLGADIPLRWQTYQIEPNKCILSDEPRQGEQAITLYHRMMPFFYAEAELAQRATPTTSIHVGEKYSLYFLFTYERTA